MRATTPSRCTTSSHALGALTHRGIVAWRCAAARLPRSRSLAKALPMLQKSTRPKHRSSGSGMPRRSRAKCAHSIPGRWPRRASTASNCESGMRRPLIRPVSSGRGRRPPGSVLTATREGIDVVCGTGVLRILKLQLAGPQTLAGRGILAGTASRRHALRQAMKARRRQCALPVRPCRGTRAARGRDAGCGVEGRSGRGGPEAASRRCVP